MGRRKGCMLLKALITCLCHHEVFPRVGQHVLLTLGPLILWVFPLRSLTVSSPWRHPLGGVLPSQGVLPLGGAGVEFIPRSPQTVCILRQPDIGSGARAWGGVAHSTRAIVLPRPVRTGFIRLWSGLPVPGKPRLGPGVSSDMGRGPGGCQPGPLPAGNHRGH